jgi:hypothetical protein
LRDTAVEALLQLPSASESISNCWSDSIKSRLWLIRNTARRNQIT